jgi:adenosylcobinamide-phosphate synthase
VRAGRLRGRAVLAALTIDAALGDGRSRWHPVAVAGRALDRGYRPWRHASPPLQLAGGAVVLAAVAGGAAACAWTVERLARRTPVASLALGAALKPSFALRDLLVQGGRVADALEAGDLDAARAGLAALVSRPAADLPAALVASAAIESLAENLVDSVVAPLLCFRLLGLPGAAAYRVINTADAMVGYRDEREWLGKLAARSDDVLNLVPARVSALALAAAAVLLEGTAAGRRALRTAWRESGRTASPNAGWPMAAMAGALGRRLEKRDHYVLGADWPEPGAADVRRARAIVKLAGALAGAVLAVRC